MKRHYIIPIFIPEKACPFRCIYCNQYNITQKSQSLTPQEIKYTIEQYLKTFPASASKKIGFFGGTFTGMPIAEQSAYLQTVYPYIERGDIDEIQLSTRPDYIDEAILDNLKRYGVGTIELGAQSLNEEVLRHSGRGHSVEDVERASRSIRAYGFRLGLQMMIGLPHDSRERTIETAQKIVNYGADVTRIYPTLVIKETYLEKLYLQKQYTPLTLTEAIDHTIAAMEIFEAAGVTILRIGLHPTRGLISGCELVAGPFHVSFKELVMTERWRRKLLPLVECNDKEITITVPRSELNAAIGYEGSNKRWLLQHFEKVHFIAK